MLYCVLDQCVRIRSSIYIIWIGPTTKPCNFCRPSHLDSIGIFSIITVQALTLQFYWGYLYFKTCLLSAQTYAVKCT